MAAKRKKKQPPKLSTVQRWKWRALEAEMRAEQSEARRLRLKLETALQIYPTLFALYEEMQQQQQRARNRHIAYRAFTAEVAERFGIAEEELVINDETGRVSRKENGNA